jgi:hypothetical protein
LEGQILNCANRPSPDLSMRLILISPLDAMCISAFMRVTLFPALHVRLGSASVWAGDAQTLDALE